MEELCPIGCSQPGPQAWAGKSHHEAYSSLVSPEPSLAAGHMNSAQFYGDFTFSSHLQQIQISAQTENLVSRLNRHINLQWPQFWRDWSLISCGWPCRDSSPSDRQYLPTLAKSSNTGRRWVSSRSVLEQSEIGQAVAYQTSPQIRALCNTRLVTLPMAEIRARWRIWIPTKTFLFSLIVPY